MAATNGFQNRPISEADLPYAIRRSPLPAAPAGGGFDLQIGVAGSFNANIGQIARFSECLPRRPKRPLETPCYATPFTSLVAFSLGSADRPAKAAVLTNSNLPLPACCTVRVLSTPLRFSAFPCWCWFISDPVGSDTAIGMNHVFLNQDYGKQNTISFAFKIWLRRRHPHYAAGRFTLRQPNKRAE